MPSRWRHGRFWWLAVLVVAAGLAFAPAAGAESDCVLSGQTPEYCMGKYLESVSSALPPDFNRDVAISNGYRTVEVLGRHPNKAQFGRIVDDLIDKNSFLTVEQAVFLVQMAVHWLGPPGLENQIDQAMTG